MTERLDTTLLDDVQFESLAVHAGVEHDSRTGALMTPVFLNSTYAQPRVGQHTGYEYSRTDNPTRTALQAALANLEGGRYGLAFASGMAAIDTLMRLLKPGDHLLSGNDVYGGTYRLFDKIIRHHHGIDVSFVDTRNLEAVAAAIRPETRMIWLETPTNPLLKLTDIESIAKLTRGQGIHLAVDNTFASPALQQPLTLGADLVVHSTTKYLGGHSDVVGGAVVFNDTETYERVKFLQNAIGAIPGPMDCFLTLRGIKTLALRMKAHSDSALELAGFLEAHPLVEEVIYPFLENHPDHALARRQMRGGGGIVSFVVRGGKDAACVVAEQTHLFTLAESLGGVESLIEVPAVMTHASVDDESMAVDPGLVRISVGIENVDDLRRDLAGSLDAAAKTAGIEVAVAG